jgi:hypothetical protein
MSKDAGDLNRRMQREILFSAQEKGKLSWLRNRPVRQANSLIVGSGCYAARRLLRGVLARSGRIISIFIIANIYGSFKQQL